MPSLTYVNGPLMIGKTPWGRCSVVPGGAATGMLPRPIG
jgi:hypothetical protein